MVTIQTTAVSMWRRAVWQCHIWTAHNNVNALFYPPLPISERPLTLSKSPCSTSLSFSWEQRVDARWIRSDDGMILTGETEVFLKNLSQCHFYPPQILISASGQRLSSVHSACAILPYVARPALQICSTLWLNGST
jgi:hypothetical protein